MPYTGTDFTAASPGEDEAFGFDFKKDLIVDESIQSASFKLRREPDKVSFDAKLTRGVTISGTKVSQYVTDLPPGRYRLSCIVETNLGYHELHSYIPCS